MCVVVYALARSLSACSSRRSGGAALLHVRGSTVVGRASARPLMALVPCWYWPSPSRCRSLSAADPNGDIRVFAARALSAAAAGVHVSCTPRRLSSVLLHRIPRSLRVLSTRGFPDPPGRRAVGGDCCFVLFAWVVSCVQPVLWAGCCCPSGVPGGAVPGGFGLCPTSFVVLVAVSLCSASSASKPLSLIRHLPGERSSLAWSRVPRCQRVPRWVG